MNQPPKGIPVRNRWKKQDKDILGQLKEFGWCQQPLLTDGGHHHIYCGGYFHGAATATKDGLRCEYHK